MTTTRPGDPLRFLLVSENEEMRDLLTEALRGRLGDFRLFWVAQPELASSRTLDLLPSLIFIDDCLGGASPAVLVKQLVQVSPASPVVVLVQENAIGAARQAVVAGARSFATKPLNSGDLAANVRDILGQQKSAAAPRDGGALAAWGRIIVFCAPKGGTGRTSLTINTAIALRQITNRPLVLVDADFAAPSVDVALNLHDDHNLTDLLPRLAQLDVDLASGMLAQHASGIRVLLAPPPAELESPISVPQVQQILAQLKRMFGWVVVDLGLPLDETAFAFLDAADRIVVTLLPEMTGLRNIRLMLNQFSARGYAPEKVKLVLNRATMPAAVSQRDIEKRLHVKVTHTVPDDQGLASHSINRGVPFMLAKNRSALARAVTQIATQLARDLPFAPVSEPKPAPGGNPLLGRWAKRQPLPELAPQPVTTSHS